VKAAYFKKPLSISKFNTICIQNKRERITSGLTSVPPMPWQTTSGQRLLMHLAVHGFDYKITAIKQFHVPGDKCTCVLCVQVCERYHITMCMKWSCSVAEYSRKNWTCMFYRFQLLFIHSFRCPLSPTSYTLCINDTIINPLLFADDQILLSGSDDDLHRALYTLHNTTKQFQMKTFPLKAKVMTFKGQILIRSKIVIDNTMLVQVNIFTYLWYKTLYKEEKDVTSKISKFL
jgi:hypothetical protein